MGGGGQPQHMYLLEGGILVVPNLLKIDQWVLDEERTHCNVCVQQFFPFRRRHHCRTCGEVVCSGCSSQRKLHLTDVNVECATRVCTFCMIRATDAAIRATEFNTRGTFDYRMSAPQTKRKDSIMSIESDLTTGSVVQLWPNPIPNNESARLEIVRNSTIRTAKSDPTMDLLVSIVSRTLECPVAFIGILDDKNLILKASIGWERTHISRDDCVCSYTLMSEKTMIVGDTNHDKHFHATNLTIGSESIRYYAGVPIRVLGQYIGTVCAIDVKPHETTTSAMKSTLEAVANIVSEVLEQRVDSTIQKPSNLTSFETNPSIDLGNQPVYTPYKRNTETALLDLTDSLKGLSLKSTPDSRNTSLGMYSDSTSSYCLGLPSMPKQYGSKIHASINTFQQLLSSFWKHLPTGSTDGMKHFEISKEGRIFLKTSTTLYSSCDEVAKRVLAFDDVNLYENLIYKYRRHQELNKQTFIDHLQFQPDAVDIEYDSVMDLRVLSHSRQYPDGSRVVIVLNGTKLYEPRPRDLLFGWFIAPCNTSESAVTVSCIVSQSNENQQERHHNISMDLMLRLRMFLPRQEMRPCTRASTLSNTSSIDNQIGHGHSLLDQTRGHLLGPVSESAIEIHPSSFDSMDKNRGSKLISIRSKKMTEVSALARNEKMVVDLLDKTICTQEILAAQQHVMANVMGYHGTQLQRISSAIHRVETILSERGTKLKLTNGHQMTQPSRHSLS